ncbi:TIGR02391 family protein [Curtobacterium flaccumfaciens]|uniref:TIGR02391 family protein n=1 Tax=Curtobacterium flaccumfaciens TaxID=2035 RepID=UPI001375C941|nr:TIGR02391 family protein [Curtobacterium flaccumfaciens]
MATLSPDLLRAGSTEEVALELIRGYGEGADINGHNVFNQAKEEFGGEPDGAVLVGRVSDAWAWLVAHQCVGPSGQASGSWQRVTRQGAAIAAGRSGLHQLQADDLLSERLMQQLLTSAKPAFSRGDFDTAAFAAMKAVEVEVRILSGLPNDLVGTKLIQEAFKHGGPLCDVAAEGGEQVATMNLFMGAIGAFKNPASHRTVVFQDPLEAAEVVQLADLLLRMLHRIGHHGDTTND